MSSDQPLQCSGVWESTISCTVELFWFPQIRWTYSHIFQGLEKTRQIWAGLIERRQWKHLAPARRLQPKESLQWRSKRCNNITGIKTVAKIGLVQGVVYIPKTEWFVKDSELHEYQSSDYKITETLSWTTLTANPLWARAALICDVSPELPKRCACHKNSYKNSLPPKDLPLLLWSSHFSLKWHSYPSIRKATWDTGPWMIVLGLILFFIII